VYSLLLNSTRQARAPCTDRFHSARAGHPLHSPPPRIEFNPHIGIRTSHRRSCARRERRARAARINASFFLRIFLSWLFSKVLRLRRMRKWPTCGEAAGRRVCYPVSRARLRGREPTQARRKADAEGRRREAGANLVRGALEADDGLGRRRGR